MKARAAKVAVALVAGVVAAVAAIAFFGSRDHAVTGTATGPGVAVPAQPGALGARLRAGNVELRYGASADARALIRLARDVAGPPSAALAAAGQEIRVVREPGLHGVRALAWRRALSLPRADPGALRAFAEHWLGRGVQG